MVEIDKANIEAALRNLWAVTFGDGIEPYRPSPSTVIYDEPHRTLRRYDPAPSTARHAADDSADPEQSRPVLLVPPLAVPISCYDLRPGQSMAAHLRDQGRTVYVIDYGSMSAADSEMGFEDWTEDIVPTAIRAVSNMHFGADVDVIGWSFGGTIAILTAASHPDLPIASLIVIGTPIDQSKNPGTALPRALAPYTGGAEVRWFTKLLNGIPAPIVQAGFRVQAASRELTRPLFVAQNLNNPEALARMEAIDRFIDRMPGYPGRLYRQSYIQFIVRNELARGRVNLGPDHVVELSAVKVRTLLIASPTDLLAPAPCVKPGAEVLSGAEVRYVEVHGSHLGMIAGPDAATTTYPLIDEFLS